MVASAEQEPSGTAEPVGVFTSDEVLHITGVSRRRLAYWIERGIVVADVDEARGRGRVRLFSFVNLVEIRVALWLRDKVSLQLIRKVVARLREREGLAAPLADVTFAVIESGRPPHEVVMQRHDGSWETWSGQRIMEIFVPLERLGNEVQRAAQQERRRRRRVGQVERRRGALGSLPVVAGTRVPTKAIWSLHQAGYDTERILASYPGLEPRDVEAALATEADRRSGSGRRDQSA